MIKLLDVLSDKTSQEVKKAPKKYVKKEKKEEVKLEASPTLQEATSSTKTPTLRESSSHHMSTTSPAVGTHFEFGKYKGQRYDDPTVEPSYIDWCLRQNKLMAKYPELHEKLKQMKK